MNNTVKQWTNYLVKKPHCIFKSFNRYGGFTAGDMFCHTGEGIFKYFRLFVCILQRCQTMRIPIIFSILICVASCRSSEQEVKSAAALKAELIQADRAFSRLSEEKGMRTAFLQFIDSNGVMLRPGKLPFCGGEAIELICSTNDTSFTLTWEPRNGEVAQSGELGYTYGIYSMKPHDADTVLYGTYVSIWKRQPDGSWKFVLDTGNEGVNLEEAAVKEEEQE